MEYTPILNAITPSKEDELLLQDAINTISSQLAQAAEHTGVAVHIVPGGSTAKGTYLAGQFDVDMFVRFKTDQENISDLLELMLAELNVVFERVHGSRDYFHFTYQDYFFEIVPVKYVDEPSQAVNVTDMSPLHVFWVNEHLTPELRNAIRLAKQFCKAIRVYGAESYINGFSGHVLDILIIYYGGFEALLKAASTWAEKTVVDPEQYHQDAFATLNASKLHSPLIVIDPIDAERNAAAALAVDKYNQFKASAKQFLEHPDATYFQIPSFDKTALLKKKFDDEYLFLITITPQQGKKDIVITKVLKVFEFLQRHLQLYDFPLRHADWFVDETGEKTQCYLYFFVQTQDLSPTMEREGPPLENFQGVQRFKEVHGTDVFEKNNRLYVHVRRDFTRANDCLLHLLRSEFVTSRIKEYEFEQL
jgi:tRNA nucleotidyltransferase (CCA-adding enzyme)